MSAAFSRSRFTAPTSGGVGGGEKHRATALVTLIALPGRADEPEAA